MRTLQQAQATILQDVLRMEPEEVPLDQAFGRVLAEALRAVRDVPPWDNSAMDGYAVRAEDTAEGEVRLRLLEMVGAGSVGQQRIVTGTASGIMTGAPLPAGADAVVKVELTDGALEGAVTLSGRAEVGQNIRRRGEDIRADQVILRAGRTLDPAAVGLIASQGLPTVRVARRPRVAILSTGDELVLPGQPLGLGQIYASNHLTLMGMSREAGAEPLDQGSAPDDLEGLVDRLRGALSSADVLLTTGGVSVGAFDYVKEAFQRVGVEMEFWKVQMKPGKPLAFGRVRVGGRRVPVFGLPGNPVSCMVNFLQFVRPYLRASMGDPRPFLPVIEAVAGEDFRGKPGWAQLLRVRLEQGDGGWRAFSAGSQSSGVLATMAEADGLMWVDVGARPPREGEPVRVQVGGLRGWARADYGLDGRT